MQMLHSKLKMMRGVSFLSLLTAYDSGDTGWKMNAEGTHVEMKDGHPIFIGSDGKEMIVKGDTLSQLRGEAKSHREAKESLEAKFKDYEGLDPKAAREALDKLKTVDLSKMVEAGKLEEVKSAITGEFNTKLNEKDKALEGMTSKYNNLLITNVFANSEFVRNNIAVPRDMFEATFRSNFSVENDKVVVKDRDGNLLMSKKNVGEYATPEEALELLVDRHPSKEQILRADVGNGSGNNGGGGNGGGGRTIRRAEFDRLTPQKQAEISGKVRSGEMKLID